MHVTDEYTVFEHFNSKGIRGPDYSYQKSPNSYRIFILGDSFAEGYQVEFDELFSEVLQKQLNKRGDKHYEVINTGTGGYSTDQELILFQTEGKKYHPDLTILMFHSNDVWFNNQAQYPRGHKPLFILRDGRLTLTNIPVPPPQLDRPSYEMQTATSQISILRKIKRWLHANSYLYTFVSRKIKDVNYLYTLAMQLGLADNPGSLSPQSNNETVPIPDELRIWEREYNDNVRDAWKITEALIKKLVEETTSIGSKLLVFYIPGHAAVYRKDWEATKRRYGISDAKWDIERDRNELEGICERNAIDFMNPLGLLRVHAEKLERDGKRLYFTKDGHWNVEGHRFVGDILFKHVKSMYLSD